LPIVASPLALMVPTWAISFASLVSLPALFRCADDRLDRLVDAALDLHRVVARGDELGALAVDRLRENRRRRGAVTSHVAGLRRDLAHHLRAHVLETVLELDLLRDRHAVLGDRRRAEALLDDDVAALGAEGDLHRVRERVDARRGSCCEQLRGK
jgi:hypothetical protein